MIDAEARVRSVELLISRLLRTGVIASLVIVVAGTVISFVHHPSYLHSAADLRLLKSPGARFPHTIAEVFREAFRLRGKAIVMIGILLLIATPVMRVAVSVASFAYQRDRTYVLITLVVLALLVLSFSLGRAGG